MDAAPLPSPPPQPLSSFIGRAAELRELRSRLESARLVTLTGPGGCGKTRLAIALAAAAAASFPDGVAYADLASVSDPSIVLEAVASSLGMQAHASNASLIRRIGGSALLLVVDTAEPAVPAVAALVTAILVACRNVRVLVGSRSPLGVGGETVWSVPPMRLPPGDSPPDPEALVAYDAIELFAARVVEHESGFRLTAENAAPIVDICRRLDGIPLALELTAGRVRSLGLSELERRLSDGSLLAARGSRSGPARHRTLGDMVEWSHDLLDERERALFKRLAIFPGTFDLEAVEAVCASPDVPAAEPADLLHELVDKSLVALRPRPDGGVRYELLEVIRQYARHRLGQEPEPGLPARHAAHYAGLVRRLAAGGPGAVEGRPERMAAEYENVRLAMDWAAGDDSALAEEMADGLRWYWMLRGRLGEARARLSVALARRRAPVPVRARLLADAATWSQWVGDFDMSRDQVAEAASLLDEAGDGRLMARILQLRAVVLCRDGEFAAAEDDLRTAVRLLGGERPGASVVIALSNLAFVQLYAGRAQEALDTVDHAMAIQARLTGPRTALSRLFASHARGSTLLALGYVEEARDQFVSGIEIVVAQGNYTAAQGNLSGLACVAAASGDHAGCLEFLAAADRSVEIAGGREPLLALPLAEVERQSRAALGTRRSNDAWTRGLGMDLRAAADRARAAGWTMARPMLTERKLEVVRLVALGLSDKEIARRLSLSIRTVNAHLEQIRNQLGVHSRMEVVMWAMAQGLMTAPDARADPAHRC